MRVQIVFGAVAPLLESQLGRQGLRLVGSKLLHIQKDVDAVARLSVRRVLSDAETVRARRRLVKVITKYSEKIKP